MFKTNPYLQSSTSSTSDMSMAAAGLFVNCSRIFEYSIILMGFYWLEYAPVTAFLIFLMIPGISILPNNTYKILSYKEHEERARSIQKAYMKVLTVYLLRLLLIMKASRCLKTMWLFFDYISYFLLLIFSYHA